MSDKVVFIVGYTGAVGKQLVAQLVQHNPFKKVVLIGRREVKIDGIEGKNFEQKVIDFDDIENHRAVFEGTNIGFCCLGTTRGQSGKAGFIKVDHDYIMNVAKVSRSSGCDEFHLVSSVGADANSMFLYTQVKGQVEQELGQVGFNHVMIYRPKYLSSSDRGRFRCGECLIVCLCWPIMCCCPSALATPVPILARAMVASACVGEEEKQDYKIFLNPEIFSLGKN